MDVLAVLWEGLWKIALLVICLVIFFKIMWRYQYFQYAVYAGIALALFLIWRSYTQ